MQEVGEVGWDVWDDVENLTWRKDSWDFLGAAFVEQLLRTPFRSLSNTKAAATGEVASLELVWINSSGKSKYRLMESSSWSFMMADEAHEPHSNFSRETVLDITFSKSTFASSFLGLTGFPFAKPGRYKHSTPHLNPSSMESIFSPVMRSLLAPVMKCP